MVVHPALRAQTLPAPSLPGSVVGWGSTEYGQATVPILTNVTAIAGGNYHSLALLSDQTVVAWGSPYDGQTAVPPGLLGVKAIAAGSYHSLALKHNGTIVGWGRGNKGQTTAPEGLTNAMAVAAGAVHSVALTSNGTVVAWGENGEGQTTVPLSLNNVIAIAAGSAHCLALKNDGTVVGWGRNQHGQATPPAGLTNVIAISAGGLHSLALKSDGTVVGWGYNGYGEATPPSDLSNVTAIATGQFHSVALKSDGTVAIWGVLFGGNNIPVGLRGVAAIAAGGNHDLAIQASATNQTPTDITLSRHFISENQPIGTTIGTLSAVDADIADTHTFAIIGGPGGVNNSSFSIAGNALQTAAIFDYETKSRYSFRVQATDASGFLFAKIFIVEVEPAVPLRILTDTSLGFSNGQLGFLITGMNGSTVVVQGSTNLVDWTPITTNVLGSTPLPFSDPQQEFPTRYYRAIIP